MKTNSKLIIILGCVVIFGVGSISWINTIPHLSDAEMQGNTPYFMRYYSHNFPVEIHSLSMDTDVVTVNNNATLTVELTDELSNDNKTFVVEVIPEDVSKDGNNFWNIHPNRFGNISFEHEPKQKFNFVISPEQFAGECVAENLLVNLYGYYPNGTANNTPIDVEKIPIISKYPKGDATLCY